MSHSTGPWHADGGTIWRNGIGGPETIGYGNHWDDIRLMAAAPDLLAALKRIACHVPAGDAEGREVVRAAIARAEEG